MVAFLLYFWGICIVFVSILSVLLHETRDNKVCSDDGVLWVHGSGFLWILLSYWDHWVLFMSLVCPKDLQCSEI